MATRITDPDTDPDRETCKTCLSGGMHFPILSSLLKLLSDRTNTHRRPTASQKLSVKSSKAQRCIKETIIQRSTAAQAQKQAIYKTGGRLELSPVRAYQMTER